MALQILEENGTFELHGSLTTATTKSFIMHFEHMINTVKNITINIDNVNTIDATGVEALKMVMTNALRSNHIFSVIGNGCKDIYDEYKSSVTA